MPDAGLDVEADPFEHERRGQLGTDAPAERLRVYGIGDVRQQDDELVAAEPGDAVAFPHDPRQPRADLLKQQVTVVVAERVVDLLEAVEVEQQQRDPAAGAVGAPDGREGAPAQQLAVRQPGQRIVIGQVAVVVGLLAQAPRRRRHQPEEREPEDGEPTEQCAAHEDGLVADVALAPDATARTTAARPGVVTSEDASGERICRTGPASGDDLVQTGVGRRCRRWR